MTYTEIIKKGLELGISEVELYIENSVGMTIRLNDGELDSNSSKEQFGMSIRGLYQGKMGYVYVESTDETTIDFAYKSLIDNALRVTSTNKEFIYDGKGVYQEVKESHADYNDYSNLYKLGKLKDLSKRILDSNSLIKKIGLCQYSENSSNTKIINSKGLNLSRDFSYASVVAGALASDGKETSVGYSMDFGFELEKMDYDKIVKEASEEAVSSLGAGSIKTGVYPAVFRRDVMTDILNAFSSVFCGDSAVKKMTLLTEKIGQQVFGKNINIIDDPFAEKGIIKQPFDDEGVPCYTKKIVENGVFKGLIHNLASADYFKTASTGNGFKNSVAGGVNVSPTNLYLEPGTKSKDELIASIDKGVFVTSVSGLHAGLNPVSGAFNVQATGFEIENGVITRPITLFVVSSNFYELLNNIDEIGNDIEPKFLGIAAPCVKINKVTISGK